MTGDLPQTAPVFRIWVDPKRRVISFHPMEGCPKLEFHSRELFFRCADQYPARQFRWQ